MKYIYFLAFLVLFSCKKNELDISNVKVKSISRIQKGLKCYKDYAESYDLGLLYNGSKVSGTDLESIDYEKGYISSVDFLDSIFHKSELNERTIVNTRILKESYKFVYSQMKYYRYMEMMELNYSNTHKIDSSKPSHPFVVLYKDSSAYGFSETKEFYYNDDDMVDSIITVEYVGNPIVNGYSYNSNNNIVESRQYWIDENETVLFSLVKYKYSEAINPIHLIYKQCNNVILSHFDEFLISYNLPIQADYYKINSEGLEELIDTEHMSANFGSENLPSEFMLNNKVYQVTYY